MTDKVNKQDSTDLPAQSEELYDHEPLCRTCPKCHASVHEFCKSIAVMSKGQHFSPGHYHDERQFELNAPDLPAQRVELNDGNSESKSMTTKENTPEVDAPDVESGDAPSSVSDDRLREIIAVGKYWCGNKETQTMAAELISLKAQLSTAQKAFTDLREADAESLLEALAALGKVNARAEAAKAQLAEMTKQRDDAHVFHATRSARILHAALATERQRVREALANYLTDVSLHPAKHTFRDAKTVDARAAIMGCINILAARETEGKR
jgi:hypothetical protein